MATVTVSEEKNQLKETLIVDECVILNVYRFIITNIIILYIMFRNSTKIIFGLLIVIIISVIGFNFNTIIEGLTLTKSSNQYTSCTQAQNCNDCTTSNIMNNNTDSPCYWNNSISQCGSFADPGYSKTCDGSTTGSSGSTTGSSGSTTGSSGSSDSTSSGTGSTSSGTGSTTGSTTDSIPSGTDSTPSGTDSTPSGTDSKYTLFQTPVYLKN